MRPTAIAIVNSEGECEQWFSPAATYPDDKTAWEYDDTKTVVHITTSLLDLSAFIEVNYYKDGAWKTRAKAPDTFYDWKDEKWNFNSTQFWAIVRQDRNNRLFASDWTQLSDCKLSLSKQGEWTEYRQALRQVPATNSDSTKLDSIVWPGQPA